jgi:hypothetical protein
MAWRANGGTNSAPLPSARRVVVANARTVRHSQVSQPEITPIADLFEDSDNEDQVTDQASLIDGPFA